MSPVTRRSARPAGTASSRSRRNGCRAGRRSWCRSRTTRSYGVAQRPQQPGAHARGLEQGVQPAPLGVVPEERGRRAEARPAGQEDRFRRADPDVAHVKREQRGHVVGPARGRRPRVWSVGRWPLKCGFPGVNMAVPQVAVAVLGPGERAAEVRRGSRRPRRRRRGRCRRRRRPPRCVSRLARAEVAAPRWRVAPAPGTASADGDAVERVAGAGRRAAVGDGDQRAVGQPRFHRGDADQWLVTSAASAVEGQGDAVVVAARSRPRASGRRRDRRRVLLLAGDARTRAVRRRCRAGGSPGGCRG